MARRRAARRSRRGNSARASGRGVRVRGYTRKVGSRRVRVRGYSRRR